MSLLLSLVALVVSIVGGEAFHITKSHASLSTRLIKPSSAISDIERTSGAIISISYCAGCNWMLRSTWLAQELLSSFREEGLIESVELRPQYAPPGGDFVVAVDGCVVWDRRVMVGFLRRRS
mmetsp:Transcript_25721/g.52721  ORF Transcript_25721/g.52721 Transcript_25721/m.52721 type:complete len:122 (+) Transcript_25721:178-543(+)